MVIPSGPWPAEGRARISGPRQCLRPPRSAFDPSPLFPPAPPHSPPIPAAVFRTMKPFSRLSWPPLSAATVLMASSMPIRAQLDFAPPNDLFANRVSLGSAEAVEVSQKVLTASSEFGDPLENSVWWEWTAPRDGWWEVDMHPESDAMTYGPLVQVYQGDSPDTLFTASDGGLDFVQP